MIYWCITLDRSSDQKLPTVFFTQHLLFLPQHNIPPMPVEQLSTNLILLANSTTLFMNRFDMTICILTIYNYLIIILKDYQTSKPLSSKRDTYIVAKFEPGGMGLGIGNYAGAASWFEHKS
jgi:hypothetical protein